MLRQDMERKDTPLWAYFCQISDSTTSYGSHSGALHNEKSTWGPLSTYVERGSAGSAPPLWSSFPRVPPLHVCGEGDRG